MQLQVARRSMEWVSLIDKELFFLQSFFSHANALALLHTRVRALNPEHTRIKHTRTHAHTYMYQYVHYVHTDTRYVHKYSHSM